MSQFRYNSYHKLLTGIAIIVWAVWHFSGENESGKYYENGQIKRTGMFSNGKNNGKWTWHYENGNKKIEGHFVNGKRNGLWTTWDLQGNKLTEGNYENDQLNGEFIRWNSKGEIIEHATYFNDIEVNKIAISIPSSGE